MAQQGSEPCSGDNSSDSEIESINAEELVMFESTQTFYSNRQDMAVIYSLGQAVTSTPKDWIGLFRLGWQTPYDFSTYQWASNSLPPNDEQQQGGRRRKSLFPQADIRRLSGGFQFLYVTGDAQVIGVSESFQVSDKMLQPASPVFVNEEIPKCLSLISLASFLSSDESEAAEGKNQNLLPEDTEPLPVLEKATSREAPEETILTDEGKECQPPTVKDRSCQEASLQTGGTEPEVKAKPASAKKSKKSSPWKKPWKKVKAKASEKVVEQNLPLSYADVVKGMTDKTNQDPPSEGNKLAENKSSQEGQPTSAQPFPAGEQTHVKNASSVTVVVDLKKPPSLLQEGQAADTANSSEVATAAPAVDNWTLSDFVIGAGPAVDWSTSKLRFMSLADPDRCYEEYHLSMRQQSPCRVLEEVHPANHDNVCGRLSPPCQSDASHVGKLALSKEVVLYQHGNTMDSSDTTPVALPSVVLISALRQAFQKSCFELYRQKMIESAMEEDAHEIEESSPEASTPSCRIVHGWKTLGDAEEFPMWILPVSELRSFPPSQETVSDPEVGQTHPRVCGDKSINYADTRIRKFYEESYRCSTEGTCRSIESNHRSKKGLGLSFISSRLRNLRKKRNVKSSKSERSRGKKTAMLAEALALMTGENAPGAGIPAEEHDSLGQPDLRQDTSRSKPTTLVLNIKSKWHPSYGRKNGKATDQDDDESRIEETGADAIIVSNAEERLELLSFALSEALQNNARLTHELSRLQENLPLNGNLPLPTTFLTDILEDQLNRKEVGQQTPELQNPSGNQTSVHTNDPQSQAPLGKKHARSPSKKTKTTGRATNTEKNVKNAGSNTRVVVTKDMPSQCSKAQTVVRSTNTAPAPTRKDAENNTSVIQKSDAEINTSAISRKESSVQCCRNGAAEATNIIPVNIIPVNIIPDNIIPVRKPANLTSTNSSGYSTPPSSCPTEIPEIDQSGFEKWREVCSKRMSRLKKAVSKKKKEFVQLTENAVNCEKKIQTLEQQLHSLRSVLSVETIKRLKAEKDLDELRLRFWNLLASRQNKPWTPVCQRKALLELSLPPPNNDLLQLSTSAPIPDQPKHKACENHYERSPVGPNSEPHVLTITPFPRPPDETLSNQDVKLSFAKDGHKHIGSSFCDCGGEHSVNLSYQLLSLTKHDDTTEATKAEKVGEKKPKGTKVSKKARQQQTSSADHLTHLAPSRPKKKTAAASEGVAVAEVKKTSSSTMSFKRFLMPAMTAIAETFGAAKSRNSKLFSAGSGASLSSVSSVSSQDKRFSLSKTSAASATGQGVAKASTKKPNSNCSSLKAATVQSGSRKRTKRDNSSSPPDDKDEEADKFPLPCSHDLLLGQLTALDALSHPQTLEKVKIFAEPLDLTRHTTSPAAARRSSFSFGRARRATKDWAAAAAPDESAVELGAYADLDVEGAQEPERAAPPSVKACATSRDAAESGFREGAATHFRWSDCSPEALKEEELGSADVTSGGDKLQEITEGGVADNSDVITTTLPDVIAALVTPTVMSTSLVDEDLQTSLKANLTSKDAAVSRRLQAPPPPSAARPRPPTPIIPLPHPFTPPASVFQLCPASFTRPWPVVMETPPESPRRAEDASPPRGRRRLPGGAQEVTSLGSRVRRPVATRELSNAGRRSRRLTSPSVNSQICCSVAEAAPVAEQFEDVAEHLQVAAVVVGGAEEQRAGVGNSEVIPAPSAPVIPEIRITLVKPDPACQPQDNPNSINCDLQVVTDRSLSDLRDVPDSNLCDLRDVPHSNLCNLQDIPDSNLCDLQDVPDFNLCDLRDVPASSNCDLQVLESSNCDLQVLPDSNLCDLRDVPDTNLSHLREVPDSINCDLQVVPHSSLCDFQDVPDSSPDCAGPLTSFISASSRPVRCSPVAAQCRSESLGDADNEVKVIQDLSLNKNLAKKYSQTVEGSSFQNASQPLALNPLVGSGLMSTAAIRDKLVDVFKTPIQVSEVDPAVILCSPFAPETFLYPPLASLSLRPPPASALGPATTPQVQPSPATTTTIPTTPSSWPPLSGCGFAAGTAALPALLTRASGVSPAAQHGSLLARPPCQPDTAPQPPSPPSFAATLPWFAASFPPAPTCTSLSPRIPVPPPLPSAPSGDGAPPFFRPAARPSLEVLTMARQLSVHHLPGRPGPPAAATAARRPSPRAFHYDLEAARRDSVGQQLRQGRCFTCGMKFPPAVDRYLVEEHLFFHDVFCE